MSQGGKLQQLNKSYTLVCLFVCLISEASSFHLQEPVWPLSEALGVSSFTIDLKDYGVSHGSLCLPRGDSSQAGEDMEMGGLVSFCCITNYLETQWLKLEQFIISH